VEAGAEEEGFPADSPAEAVVEEAVVGVDSEKFYC
jgi:hypothetical protein